VDTAGDHADSGHPSHAAACPTAVLHELTPVGHSGRGNPWTPNAGHLDAQTPAPDSGHRSGGQARVDTGRSHRTLDAGRGRGHGDEGTAGIRTSWATTPSGRALGRPTVFLWTAPAALGDHDGSAVGPPASARLPRTTRQLLGRSAGQAAPRRIAVVCWIRMVRVEGNGTKESLGVRVRVLG
jgi:hypothetical protein